MVTTREDLSVVTPADWVPGPPQGSWTYEDYAALPDDGQHYEVVNGVLVMTPAPTPEHQNIALEIASYLRTQVKLAGLGRVFMGPIDVELGPKNVYQPDIIVVLKERLSIIREKRIVGAPDLAVEIASPGTAMVDQFIKYQKYAQAGITEYWIVKPTTRTVEVMVLEDGEYRSPQVFSEQQMLLSKAIPGLQVRVEQFFV